jgi:hypothetical protein
MSYLNYSLHGDLPQLHIWAQTTNQRRHDEVDLLVVVVLKR